MPYPKHYPVVHPVPNPVPNPDGEPTLFDADVVAENAGEWQRSIWMAKIRALAATGRPFTSDAVQDGMPELDHPNRLGALMRAAAGEGLIEAVGFESSSRPSRHGAIVRVWRGRAAA